MNLIIDIGNTYVKTAVFKDSRIQYLDVFLKENIEEKINSSLKRDGINNCIISSVGTLKKGAIKSLKSVKNTLWLDHATPIPFKNKYKSPKTLGVDRIALVSAAVMLYPKKSVLIIDAGTCITYDLVLKNKDYLGGAISPGINIRYKALNHYTANLPELNPDEYSLVGRDTISSIHSGVLNGIIQEIDGVISQYQSDYQNLTVVLTGGDTIYLAKKLKSSIFATPNFLLEGLNRILIHNLDE